MMRGSSGDPRSRPGRHAGVAFTSEPDRRWAGSGRQDRWTCSRPLASVTSARWLGRAARDTAEAKGEASTFLRGSGVGLNGEHARNLTPSSSHRGYLGGGCLRAARSALTVRRPIYDHWNHHMTRLPTAAVAAVLAATLAGCSADTTK